MKLSTKLYGIVGTLALTAAVVAGAGVWSLRTLGDELNTATAKTAVKLDLVNATRARSWEMVAALRGFFFYASLNNLPELEVRARQWDAAFKRAGEQVAQLRPLVTTPEDRSNLARFESALESFEHASADFESLCREHKFDRLPEAEGRVQEFASLSEATLGNLKDQQRKFLKESQARSESLQSQAMYLSIFTGCVLFAIVVLAVAVVRNISRTLAGAVTEIAAGADQVAAAASQIAAASQVLAQGSSEQAASIEETSASSVEINSMARSNSQNSREAAELVSSSQQKFLHTNQSLDQTVLAMGEIKTQSDRISKINKVIEEIAFQTNILALNAAVEAARAGGAGMGFAVVADEVRTLAQRCAQAAQDTSGLIQESIAKSNDGKNRVDEVAAAVRTITGEAVRVKALVDEVSQGSEEQTRGLEQIGKAISQMEQVTQQTAASAEESAAAAEELSAQSETLRAIVEHLAAMVGGSVATDSPCERASRSPSKRKRRL